MTSQEPLIPSAACFDIGHCDKRLWTHQAADPLRFCEHLFVSVRELFANLFVNEQLTAEGE